MELTEYARKVDSQGRLVIPSKLRTALGIENNQMLEFYIHEENGRVFLCVDVGENIPKTKTEIALNGKSW